MRASLALSSNGFKNELILRGVPYVIFRSLNDIETFLLQNAIPNRLARAA
jgi:hypothetical protein